MKTVHYTATFVGPWHDENRPFIDGASILTENALAVQPSLDEPLSKTTVSGQFETERLGEKTGNVSLTIELQDRAPVVPSDSSVAEEERYKYRIQFQIKAEPSFEDDLRAYLDERVDAYASLFSLSPIEK